MGQFELLLLDVGNTMAFLDMDAVAEVAIAQGQRVSAESLARVEGKAKRIYEDLMASGVSHEEGWGLYLATLLHEGGLDEAEAKRMIGPLRASHDQLNLWRRVPDDLFGALDRALAAGLRLAVISNSEGMLPQLFEHVGLTRYFEFIVDSHIEGIRKPDPEIFRRALARARVSADKAVYLGDIPRVDVDGAHAAGLSAVLIDPFDFYPNHQASPRYRSVSDWLEAYLSEAR